MTTTVRDLIDQTTLPTGTTTTFPTTDEHTLRLVWFLLTRTPVTFDSLDSPADSVDLNDTAGQAEEDGHDPYDHFQAGADIEDAASVYDTLRAWGRTSLLPNFSGAINASEGDQGHVQIGVRAPEHNATLIRLIEPRKATHSPEASGALAALGWGLGAYTAWRQMSALNVTTN